MSNLIKLFLFSILFTGCSNCTKKVEIKKPDIIALTVPCTNPPMDIYGALLKECSEQNGIMCCSYFSIIESPDGNSGLGCLYFLCRQECKENFILLSGQCRNFVKKGVRDAEESI